MTSLDEVRALVADRLADVVDRASASGDVAGVERAAGKLLDAMGRLPLEEPAAPAPEAGGGAASGGDGGRGRVLELLDRAPQVGDAADA